MEALQPGQRIGAYKILRQLGVGGMGQVYEAEHVALGVRRALKVFSTVSEHSEFLRKRFVAEGRILADLQHPRIVRVYDLVVDEDSGMAYFEMDLVLSPNGQPRTLADEQREGVGEEKIAGWFKDICEGLAYIHSQGVVHRDISLDNILIGPDGHAVITDFGIAKIIDDSYRKKIDVTVTMVYKDGFEMRMGKGLYMAPELKERDGKASFASDAWAVGILLFRMLSGSWYDVGTHLEDWLADFEYDWHPVISRLCNVDPGKRLGEGGIAALPAQLKRKVRPIPFWHRKWVIASGIVAVFLILAGVYFVEHTVSQIVDESRYGDVEKRKIDNWEMAATDMPRLAPVTSSIDKTTISQTVVRLTESVRRNLQATSPRTELGLPEKGYEGSKIHLTVDLLLQEETVSALKWGLGEFDAVAGWAIVMDAKTGAIYAMASCPYYYSGPYRIIALNYEPGAVMMVITAAVALDLNPKRYDPEVRISTNRQDPGYYWLPGDGSHKWEPTISLTEAICRSCNIVMGKVSYELGPNKMHQYLKRFGFGAKTGIELPGEKSGILPDPRKWDKASWSRVGVGQYVAVTPIQLASAYQAIANDGVRMKPYIINRIETEVVKKMPEEVGRVISVDTAQKLRQMLTGVATTNGLAPGAAIRGYSVAGKTGTAQKPEGRWWSATEYYATFCGIVPAYNPRLVILTVLDFDHRPKFHRGGDSAGPVFRRIALAALRTLGVQPDKPDELGGPEEKTM